MNTVLDEQVDLPDFTKGLAEAIQTIKAIVEEEKDEAKTDSTKG